MKPQYRLSCTSCGSTIAEVQPTIKCPKCGGFMEYVFDGDYLRTIEFKGPFTFWRYRPVFPQVPAPISLGEGGTPLHKANRLGDALHLDNLLLKDETRNPTNSFKDRSASLIVSDAVGKGFDALVCATNGNQGASLAAYSAAANIACHLVVPRALDIGKLAQMIAYDAHVEEANDSIEEAIDRAVRLAEESHLYQATTELNPLTVEALKTIPFELHEQAPVPDWVIVAMGSGVTIHAVWKGYRELEEMGAIVRKPRLVGVQAKGCAPIAEAFTREEDSPVDVGKAETVAAAIGVAKPIFGGAALKAIRESNGFAVSVADEEMLMAEREIARLEGVYAEPASAATVACLRRLQEDGVIRRNDSVVSLITSSGLKTDDILRSLSRRRKTVGLGASLATKERILRIVQSRKTYGYDLWESMGKSMTLGAIYQHLADLENRGLVASHTEGKRRYLEITERGRRVLGALDELQDLL